MFWRFQQMKNNLKTSENSEKDEALTTLTWPITSSLKDLAIQTRLPHGKVDWTLLHYEVGHVGLGRWGRLCAHHFKPIKNIKQYQRWAAEQRRAQVNGFRQYVSSGPIPIGSHADLRSHVPAISDITPQLDQPASVEVRKDGIDTGLGDISYDISNSLFNNARDSICESSIKLEEKRRVYEHGHHGDGDVKVNLLKVDHADSRLLAMERGESGQRTNEKSERNKDDLEEVISQFLSFLIDEVCKNYHQKVMSNVVKTVDDATSKGGNHASKELQYLTSPEHENNCSILELESAFRDLSIEVTESGDENSPVEDDPTENLPQNLSHASEADGISVLFHDSFNPLDVMVQEQDQDMDDLSTRQEDTDRSSVGGSTKSSSSGSKCSVSVAKVLEELKKCRQEDENISQPISACCSETAMIDGVSNDGETACPRDGQIQPYYIRMSFSSPMVLLSKPFRVKAAADPEGSNHQVKDWESESENYPVNPQDVISVASSTSSSKESVQGQIVFDYNADTEEDPEDERLNSDDVVSERATVNRTSSGSSCNSGVANNGQFPYDINLSYSDLGIELIDLNERETESSDASSETSSSQSDAQSQASHQSDTAISIRRHLGSGGSDRDSSEKNGSCRVS